MASKNKINRLLQAVRASFFMLALFGGLLVTSPASAKGIKHNFQDLDSFIASVSNGDGSALTGVYIHDVMAFPIVQQPAGSAGYVSTADNVVTQFGMASQFGTTGLLAHNFLAGQFFSEIKQGDEIVLVYGDGRTERFIVTGTLQYQALDPFNPYSDFKDLSTQSTVSAGDLFNKVYRGENRVVLQTCIDANGNSSWGRLFVIAEPATTATNVDASQYKPAGEIRFWR
jgi:hypothetical protein